MASRGKKDGKSKPPAKTGASPANKEPATPANKRSATPAKNKPAAPATDSPADDPKTVKRVTQLRQKLVNAMEDPLMRDQIVRAIRAVMKEG